jgi:hypothetical protein
MAKRCSVISPIGVEGSDRREHADAVYEYIIRPAMEVCGIDAIRSDHLHEPGRISDHMFREIFGDDLCVAVLAFQNANVFYELALAQAAARPIIILLPRGEELPFDVKDLRCVQYDLKPKPLFERVYVNEIVEHVRSLERCGWKVENPFGQATPVIARRAEPRFFSESDDYGKSDVWLQLLRDTRNSFDLMGITL